MYRRIKFRIKEYIFEVLINFFKEKKTLNTSLHIGVCSLLCHRNVNLYIYNIQSLFYQLKENLPIYVIDDGSLTKEDYKKLRKYFTVIFESQRASARKVSVMIKGFRCIRKFRFDEEVTPLRKKFDVFLLNPFHRFLYLDADLLFHSYPKEIADWLKSYEKVILYTAHVEYPIDFYNNTEAGMEYSCRLLINDYYNSKIDPSFNSGLICFPGKNCIDIKKLDVVLKYFYRVRFAYTVVAEETALYQSLISGRIKKLPTEKYANVWSYSEYQKVFSSEITSMHYSGLVKYDTFKKDAILIALRCGLFR